MSLRSGFYLLICKIAGSVRPRLTDVAELESAGFVGLLGVLIPLDVSIDFSSARCNC